MFLPYMGVAAMLVIRPVPFEQFFIPPTTGGYIRNLVTTGHVVLEEKLFDIVHLTMMTDNNKDDGDCLSGAFSSGELKTEQDFWCCLDEIKHVL